ncbi:hypothetical protein [Methanohalophilus sp.]|uniref:hypothetical protein n=1 Tax=Methanohalophilus sp. TaxID=1966352 RepID=UPI002619753D|nr:hypothetical protein [Methanohalophilus sp.]MDK2892306.1 hypothetical protein [Methanohalophilus sp.]
MIEVASARFIYLCFIICAVVLIAGCVGNDEAATESAAVSPADSVSDYADKVLAEEGAALTDEELASLEEDIAELEVMLEDLEYDSNLTLEEF